VRKAGSMLRFHSITRCMKFEQKQFTRLNCPEIGSPARLPEIRFFDARQRRQISKPLVVGDPNV
jgi:hypothetical protein